MTTGKRLYTVTVSTEIVVLAENREEAEEIAQDVPSHELGDMGFEASPMVCMPNDWDRLSLVYGPEEDVELGTLIDEGAAPEYSALLKRLESRHAR